MDKCLHDTINLKQNLTIENGVVTVKKHLPGSKPGNLRQQSHPTAAFHYMIAA